MTIATGTCGDNLTWTLNDDYSLVISGTGDMYDFPEEESPWWDYRTQILSLTLSSGITSIGEFAFYNCTGIAGSLTIPEGVTSIGDYAFDNCTGLNGTITIPSTMQTIGNYAFYFCMNIFSDLIFPEGMTTLGNFAFGGCTNLISLTIPSTMQTIGNGAFYSSFQRNGTLTIRYGITAIANYVFAGCNFDNELVIPPSVTTIGKGAFMGCGKGTVNIPSSVTSLGDSVFESTTLLECVNIPSSVTSIGSGAFRGCYNLTDIRMEAVPSTIGANAFSLGTNGHANTCTVKSPNNVADGSLESYKGSYTTFTYTSAYLVSLSETPTGYGYVSGGGVYSTNESASISATELSGYRFSSWSDGNTNASRSLTVTGDVSLTATFSLAIATLNVKVGGTWKSGSVYVKAPLTRNLNSTLAQYTNNELASRTVGDMTSTWTESKKIYVKINGTWVEK